jgi:hypothetical protein
VLKNADFTRGPNHRCCCGCGFLNRIKRPSYFPVSLVSGKKIELVRRTRHQQVEWMLAREGKEVLRQMLAEARRNADLKSPTRE